MRNVININNLIERLTEDVIKNGDKTAVWSSDNKAYDLALGDINNSLECAKQMIIELEKMKEAVNELSRFVTLIYSSADMIMVYLSDEVVITKETPFIVFRRVPKDSMLKYDRVEIHGTNIPAISNLPTTLRLGGMSHIKLEDARSCILFTSKNDKIKLSLYDLALHASNEAKLDIFKSSVDPIVPLKDQKALIKGLELKKLTGVRPKFKTSMEEFIKYSNMVDIQEALENSSGEKK